MSARSRPTALAWLESGCHPALAGREPAAMASIVEVADLADGRTTRVIGLSTFGGAGLQWREVPVQFWREVKNPTPYPWFNCSEIEGSRFLTGYERYRYGRPRPRRFIPVGAMWMTVTSNFDNINVEWTLT